MINLSWRTTGCDKRRAAYLCAIAVCAILPSLTLQGATLLNASFEAGSPGPTSFTYVVPLGGLADIYGGTQPGDGSFGNLMATEGTRILSLAGSGSYVSQDLGLLEANTTYTLTISIGHGNYSGTPPESVVSLINGTSVSGQTLACYNTGTLLYNPDPNGVTPFQDVTFSYTTGETVSGDLTFAIQNIAAGGDGGDFDRNAFDNIRLVESPLTAVPEPSTGWAALALALFLLLRYRPFIFVKRSNV